MKSMTGFGVARGKVGRSHVFTETRSVNHRFCEVNVRSPGRFARLEGEIMRRLRQKFARGKFDIFIREEAVDRESQEVILAKKAFQVLKKIQKELNLEGDIELEDLLTFREIFFTSPPQEEIEPIQGELFALIEKSLEGLEAMRRREGAKLHRWFVGRLAYLVRLLKKIEKNSSKTGSSYKKRLRKKMKQSGVQKNTAIDQQRLIQEVAMMSERADVTEEIVRLRSHLQEFGRLIAQKDPIGRKLDFLAQEMGREINTIGSKSQGIQISHQVIEFKSELERVREQVQNIE